jgi:hypothetical protein
MHRDRVALSLGVQTKRYRPYESWRNESSKIYSTHITSSQVKSNKDYFSQEGYLSSSVVLFHNFFTQ